MECLWLILQADNIPIGVRRLKLKLQRHLKGQVILSWRSKVLLPTNCNIFVGSNVGGQYQPRRPIASSSASTPSVESAGQPMTGVYLNQPVNPQSVVIPKDSVHKVLTAHSISWNFCSYLLFPEFFCSSDFTIERDFAAAKRIVLTHSIPPWLCGSDSV